MRLAEKIIIDYISDLELPMWNSIHIERFNQIAYSRWAAFEILYLIRQKPDIPPTILVENFVNKMVDMSLSNKKYSMIACIAYDAAMDILDRLL